MGRKYWFIVGAVFTLVILTLILAINSHAQELEPQDIVYDEFVYAPIVGTGAGSPPWIELRVDKVVIDPYTPMEIEVWLHNASRISEWSLELDFPTTVWITDYKYKNGLWGWIFRTDVKPIIWNGGAIFRQWSPYTKSSDLAHVVTINIQEGLVHGNWVGEISAGITFNWGQSSTFENDFWFHCQPCAGDFNNDGERDIVDGMLLYNSIGCFRGLDECYVSVFDIDGNAWIGPNDFNIWLEEYWDKPCPL